MGTANFRASLILSLAILAAPYHKVWAQDPWGTFPPAPQSQGVIVLPKLVLEQYRGVVSKNRTDVSSFYPSVSLRVAGTRDWGSIALTGDIEGFMTVTQTKNRYVNGPNLYIGSGSRPQHMLIHFGRKKEDWSRLDESWRLGLFQPRFRWDYFDPMVVGLTGLFLTYKYGGLKIMGMGSPLYVPEQGATLEVDNGKITSAHPFASPPPSTLKVFGETTPLRYNIVVPKIRDIILNPGGGALARYDFQSGAWFKGSYAYMPMNQLGIGYEGYLYLPTNQVEVNIYPRVVYHHIAALEGGFTNDRLDAWFAFLADHPVEFNVPTNITVQNFAPGYLFSPTFGVKFSGDKDNAHRLDVSYLHTIGGVKDDTGSLAVPGQQIVESRYQYRRATSVRWRLPLINTAMHRVYSMSRVVYDFSVAGVILSPEVRYEVNQRLYLSLGADVMGTSRVRSEDGGAEFFNLYRSNDRVRGSVAYAF